MTRSARVILMAAAMSVSCVGIAAAEVKVTVTREENKPNPVQARVGEEVRWVNGSGGTAHITFGDNDAVRFYVGTDSRVRFDKPGTYDYTVHISGTKAHGHTGRVIVR